MVPGVFIPTFTACFRAVLAACCEGARSRLFDTLEVNTARAASDSVQGLLVHHKFLALPFPTAGLAGRVRNAWT